MVSVTTFRLRSSALPGRVESLRLQLADQPRAFIQQCLHGPALSAAGLYAVLSTIFSGRETLLPGSPKCDSSAALNCCDDVAALSILRITLAGNQARPHRKCCNHQECAAGLF
jgi:hypothetical protein